MTDLNDDALAGRLRSRDATVAIVGLGYVGLPLACAMSEAGFRVIGIDTDLKKVDGVRAGRSHIEDVSSTHLKRLVDERGLAASADHSDLSRADAVIITVPTPLDEHRLPDLSYVKAACTSVAANVRKGSLVVLESTSYPGTTAELLIPALVEGGHQPGQDLFVGYSPERIDPSNAKWNISNTPKVVSGLTPRCLELVEALYGSCVAKLVPVSDIRTAEIGKLFENIFRGVNIALVNEFQVICDAFGIDVWEVIEACSTKPYGFMPFYPGPGLGGHCVPIDPTYLAWKARQIDVNTEFIELSARVNAGMPEYVVERIARTLNESKIALNGARVGVLGVSYKRNTSDVRESPAIRIIDLLTARGAVVDYFDPHVSTLKVGIRALDSAKSLEEFVRSNECLVVIADHDSIDWSLVASQGRNIVDTRGVMRRLGLRRSEGVPAKRQLVRRSPNA